ncbi:toprim domain-containing protein, partial [Tepidicaulis sp. LMO-SS28]|uniref:toprim domain-containing protein n=1 Tax=Tepidicaulis sp. LMO-SS28 TaxID=3447455 RepID=UPI003EE2B999
KWHRVEVEGDRKGQLSGSYRGFLDGRPAGQIMNYKTGEKAVQWVATGSKLAPEELARAKEQAEVRRKEIEAERAKKQAQAQKIAGAVYACAPEASASHAYCKAKGIRHVEGLRLVPDQVSDEAAALGVKVAQTAKEAIGLRKADPGATVLTKGDLIVPMRYGGGPLVNLQTISPEGTKRFLKGGRKEGCMHIVGNPEKTGPVLIGEGLSTCDSLHGATGHNVVVAFDAGNLERVACMIRDLAPLKRIAIAADDDHSKQHNAGLNGAKRAASAAFTSLLVPPLTDEEKAKGFTDFNDIKQARGEKALADYVEKELKLPNVKRPLTERVKSKAREVFELGA